MHPEVERDRGAGAKLGLSQRLYKEGRGQRRDDVLSHPFITYGQF